MKFRLLIFAAVAALAATPLAGSASPPFNAHGAAMSHPLVKPSPRATKAPKCPKVPCKKHRRAAPSHM